MEQEVGQIDLTGETVEDVLTDRPTSFTAREIQYLDNTGPDYGYVRQGDSWINTP